jgi:hypothetical protein
MDKTIRDMWMTPRLEFKGSVAEVLQGGGGKLSITAADPGENRCERGQGGTHCTQPPHKK